MMWCIGTYIIVLDDTATLPLRRLATSPVTSVGSRLLDEGRLEDFSASGLELEAEFEASAEEDISTAATDARADDPVFGELEVCTLRLPARALDGSCAEGMDALLEEGDTLRET